MKTTSHLNSPAGLFIAALLFLSAVNHSMAAYCSQEMGFVKIEMEEMEVTYVPDRNKKCTAKVHIKGTITNISDETITKFKFETDASKEDLDPNIDKLKPGETHKFDITFVYEKIKCESVTELVVADNDAKIKKGTKVCDFPAQTVLPVELVDFKYDEKDRGLAWVTASEINNEGFVIEQSVDAQNWNEIGFIPAAGVNNNWTSYYFPLQLADLGGYYRLKQMDFDGEFEFSSIIHVARPNENPQDWGRLYPNPARDVLYSTNPDIDAIDIFDLSGRFIKHLTVRNAEMMISDMEPGMYIGILSQGAEKKQMKFIKG